MISLIEKRMIELESKIPILVVQVENHQKMIKENFSFSNDLAELKDLYLSLNSILKSNGDKFNDSFGNSNEKILDIYKKIEELFSSIANVISNVNGKTNQISNITKIVHDFSTLHDPIIPKVDNLSIQSDSHKKSIESLKQDLDNLVRKSDSLQRDQSLLNGLINSHGIKFNEIGQEIAKALETFENRLEKFSLEMNHKFKERMDEPKNIPIQKDYDPQISDMKKDIALILNLVQNSSSQGPDQEKLNAKIKLMENSIAQMYTLLKKYENGQ